MKTKIIKEQPLYSYYGCCSNENWGYEQRIELYRNDLEKAEIGKEWVCDDQDRYPNRNQSWNVVVKVVYKDEKNIYLHCYCTNNDYSNYDELVAIELR